MDTNRTLNILLFILVVIAVGVALKLMQPVLTLFLVALMLAYLIDPVLVVMDDHLKLPLWLAVPLTGVLSLAVLSGIGLIIIVNLVEFTRDFDDFLPDIDRTLQDATEFVASRFGVDLPFDPLQELRGLLLASFDKVAVAAQSVLRGVTSFLLVFFFALLFLSAKHHMTRNFADAFSHPQSSMPAILRAHRPVAAPLHRRQDPDQPVGRHRHDADPAGLRRALRRGMGIADLPAQFHPHRRFAGHRRRRVTVLLRAVRRRPDPDRGRAPASLAAQILTGSIVEPKLLGDALNLSLLVVFLFLFFWGWLWGPVGALLAVPMTAALRIVLANIPATEPFTRLMEGRRREST